MNNIKVTINGKEILTTSGKTILDVVNENQLDTIPTLCHDARIEPFGSCFLCSVEIEGLNKLVPSCSTQVNNGMVIRTNSDKIFSSRKTALELLFSNHNADCIGPCINNCPAGVDAQGYIALISMGKYEEAIKLIKQSNPLPLSIGRVCVRNCEDECRRCYVDNPVAVNSLKRFVADIDDTKWKPVLKAKNGKKVAIIGGGPAGLTCAYYLLQEGYSITILEKLPKLGGMLRYGIPEYRLPKETLDAEINWITDMGVEVKTGTELGKDFFIDSLKSEGYDAIYVSVGAHKASKMKLNGEDTTEGILTGIDFLRKCEIDGNTKLKGTVIVMGGGNTAIDAARTSLRSGAEKVKIVYRRSINEMPAHPAEVEAAQHEGVEILFLTNPKSLVTENGKLKGIECYKMKLEEVPGERPKPVVVEGSEFVVSCDYLISAIGQQVDEAFIKTEKNFLMSKWGTVNVNESTYETSIPGVFAGGDVVSGALTAVNAIGHGKKAANAIDSYIKSGTARGNNSKFYSFKHKLYKIPKNDFSDFNKIDRTIMPELSLLERKNNFKEVELGLSTVQIASEHSRCLECGCTEYYDCTLRKYADEFNIDISNYIGDVRKFKVDKSHPFIVFDPNKCINCGKCVRTCTEIIKVSALGFVNRGFKAIVKPAMEKPLLETNCIACGNCIDVCPTGAISEKLPFKSLGTLEKSNHITICDFCSIGCSMNYKVIDNDLYYVANTTKEILDTRNNGYLCAKGRFGYRYMMDKNKLESPGIKKNNTINKVSVEEALNFTADKIKEIISKYGSDSIAVFGSPKWTNEELYLLQKFTRMGLKTNNITSFTNLTGDDLNSLDELIGATVSTATIDSLGKADVIVVINPDFAEEGMMVEMKIKKAQEKGAKFVLINSSETRLSKFADIWVDTKKASNTILLNGLIHETADLNHPDLKQLEKTISSFNPEKVSGLTGLDITKYKQLLDLLKDNNKNVVFVYALDSLKEKSKNDLKAIVTFLSLTNRLNKENNGVFILRDHANATGLLDMGINPDYLPGYVKHYEENEIKRIEKIWKSSLNHIFKPVNLQDSLLKNKIKAVLIFGEDPLADPENLKYFKETEFMLVVDTFMTNTAREADVILPAILHIEKSGTFTNCDTQVQKVVPVINSKNEFKNCKIISLLAGKFGCDLNCHNDEEVFKEICEVNRFYKNIEVNDYWISNLKNHELFKNPKNKYLTYEIDLTSYHLKKVAVLYSEGYFVKNIRNRISI